ncbi:hypothetical protein ACFSUS_26680 [Spirosoma soli]|uniref:DUF3592 domain-containing protein n=1 Tax=Spirosoma soli TaxID=1770529 RepID=A0ABW5MCL4_9BACT
MISSSATILPLLVAFGGLFVGIVCILIGWYLWYEGRDIRSSGLTVTAIVLEKFRKEDQGLMGEMINYYVRCSFQDATGLAREVDVSMRSRRWFQLSEGATTRLTYVPEELDESQPGSHFVWQLRGFAGITMIVFGIVTIAVCTVSRLLEWLNSQPVY